MTRACSVLLATSSGWRRGAQRSARHRRHSASPRESEASSTALTSSPRSLRRERARATKLASIHPSSIHEGLAEAARTFEGAWPYLTLIAAANEIADPLDPRVVEAYWVGNDLLDRVPPKDLARHVEDRFRGRIGRSWQRVLGAVGAGAVPHHTFHVFAVYPWLGLMRTGVVDQPLRVLDQCRTTPALVESASEDEARQQGLVRLPVAGDFARRELSLGQQCSGITRQWVAKARDGVLAAAASGGDDHQPRFCT